MSTPITDLTQRPPRSTRTRLGGYILLPRMLDKGRTWVKLSGAYIDTNSSAPAYADKTPVAQAYLAAAPARMVWGSDWPHPTEKPEHQPNDAMLFDLLTHWAPDEAERRRILVSNPEALYGFAKTSA